MRFFYLTLVLFFSTGCVDWGFSDQGRSKKDQLTFEEAQTRKELISNVEYDLNMDLTLKDKFKGRVEVRFELAEKEDLTLDFFGGKVLAFEINGKSVEKKKYNGFYISLPKKYLKKGSNSVFVSFSHPYSNDGEGLYKYVDVKDKNTYLYTQFEPYRANRMFPCFDQPNLKARFTMKVQAPKAWEVVTSVREVETVEKENHQEWIFPQSERFSTYTFSLHAGDYQIWENVAEVNGREIPLRLMARKSLASYVVPEEWFGLTKTAFDFFEDYFGYPYPYQKYDQLIVPDFNFGAMENVGAVTFNEDRFVTKGEKTREEKRKLAVTLYHEMAHMWFGNLVTMEWWNDLWLNESFATYSSYVGVTESTEFKEGWASLNSRKQAAYLLDQSENTHAIATDQVHSTDEAFASFDAITYRKGGSALRQLSFLLGKDYKKGLALYFSRFAGQNTTLKDFIATMAEASGRDLSTWDERWLKTAMHNKIETYYQCENNKITNFEIYQTGTREHPMLRTHKTKVALLRPYGGVLKVWKTKTVEFSGERTYLKSLIGKACPSMVYPNYGDYDFVKVVLDKKSLAQVKGNLSNIQDPFLRSLLWSDLWMMTVDQKMSLNEYLEMVEFNGLSEQRPDLLTKIWDSVDEVLKFYYPSDTDEWKLQRNIWVKFFEQAAITRIVENKDKEELQRLWFNNLVKVSESDSVLKTLAEVLKQRRTNLELSFLANPDQRWEILQALSRNGYPQATELIASELKKDPSKRSRLSALHAKASEPDLAVKQKYFKKLTQEHEENSFGEMKAVMKGIFPGNQKDLHKDFTEAFYDTLAGLAEGAGDFYANEMIENVAPIFCDQDSSRKLQDYIEAKKSLNFSVVKSLKAALYENEICKGMRQKMKIKKQNQPI